MCNPGATGTARIPPVNLMSGIDGMRKRQCVLIRRAHLARNGLGAIFLQGAFADCPAEKPRRSKVLEGIARPWSPRQTSGRDGFCSARLADSAYLRLHAEVAVSGIW